VGFLSPQSTAQFQHLVFACHGICTVAVSAMGIQISDNNKTDGSSNNRLYLAVLHVVDNLYSPTA
jgi:hypothetical protein